jgi:Sec23/Sec24 trunk domain
VFQVTLPGLGPGALQSRSSGGVKDASALLNPAIDFYKRLALECSAQQVAVDLFILNSQFADMASISEFLYSHKNFINQNFSQAGFQGSVVAACITSRTSMPPANCTRSSLAAPSADT